MAKKSDKPAASKPGTSRAGAGARESARTAADTPPEAKAPIAPAQPPVARPKRVLKGGFDKIEELEVLGWVADTAALDARLSVEVMADGRPVARGAANLDRADVREAGYGNGKSGFCISLPPVLCDGREHKIEVRELLSGLVLPGSPKYFRASKEMAEVSLEGGAISGWIRLPAPAYGTVTVHVFENGVPVAAAEVGGEANDPALFRFRMALPEKLLDGRPHVFSVRVRDPALLAAELVEITPFMLTPESVLKQYARNRLSPRMHTAAGFRYESLLTSIAQLAAKTAKVVPAGTDGKAGESADHDKGRDVTTELRQLIQAHEQVVRGFADADNNFAPLVFPQFASPKVSIVIPVHNKFPVTYNCLASLLLASNRANFEVILVDDGSTDATKDVPDLIKGVQYVRNEAAQGFIRACNRGGTLARGEYIVMLNNDIEATAGWIDELLWTFEHFEGVGMAGAKLLYADGSLQEAGGIVWGNGDPWNYGRGGNAHDPRYNYARQVDYLSGACVMLPTALWKELGGFDELFVPAYFEDTDLAFRVRDKGYKVVYTPFSQVFHFEGISSGTSTSSGIKRYQEINRPKFKGRWAKAYRHNGTVGVDVELNKDRNVEFRALVIDAEAPKPDKDAGGYAAVEEIRMLQSLGFKCTFVPQNMAWMGGYTEALQRMGVECVFAPFALSVNEVIEKRAKEFDLIYITRYHVAEQYLDRLREHAPQAKIVLNNADLHFLREMRAALGARNPELLSRAIQTRDAELAVMRKVDLVLSYTDIEKAVIISHNLDSTKVAKCPWVVDTPAQVPPYDARTDIAFLGGFNHHPNAEAVEWFVKNVMPLLRKELPGVVFRVYGSNAPKTLDALATKDVVIEGWVPDVADVYNSARIFVAPLQSGAGIKGKVIGALAHGIPCVLSSLAVEGIGLREDLDAAVVTNPAEWVVAIARLYNDPELWQAMSRHAQGFAKSHFGFEQGVVQMKESLEVGEIFTALNNSALACR
jgi:O-antigen biosynthesis protein